MNTDHSKIVTNQFGGKQSAISGRFDLIPAHPLILLAECLGYGADRYGEWNWENIELYDHINHLHNHVTQFLAGDRSEMHLVNILARGMFALSKAIDEGHPIHYNHPNLCEGEPGDMFSLDSDFDDPNSSETSDDPHDIFNIEVDTPEAPTPTENPNQTTTPTIKIDDKEYYTHEYKFFPLNSETIENWWKENFKPQLENPLKVYCDMDGVLFDFISAACALHNKPVSDVTSWEFYKEWLSPLPDCPRCATATTTLSISPVTGCPSTHCTTCDRHWSECSNGPRPMTTKEFWAPIRKQGIEFWSNLQLYPWALDLIKLIYFYDNHFTFITHPDGAKLTQPIDFFPPEKRNAATQDNLNYNRCTLGKLNSIEKSIPDKYTKFNDVIFAEHKHVYAGPNRILIDDKPSTIKKWNENGGYGILWPTPWNTSVALQELEEAIEMNPEMYHDTSVEDVKKQWLKVDYNRLFFHIEQIMLNINCGRKLKLTTYGAYFETLE